MQWKRVKFLIAKTCIKFLPGMDRLRFFRQVYYFNNSTERPENVVVYFARGVYTLDRFQSDPVESVLYIFIHVLLSRAPLGTRRLPLHCVMFYDVTSISVTSCSIA